MQIPEAARANRYFCVFGGLRVAAAALPRAIPRTATDTPLRTAPIPKSHSSSRSRSRSQPPDRLPARLGAPGASGAATNIASGSRPDTPGSRRGECGPMRPRPRRVPPYTKCDRGLPPAPPPIAALSLRGGDRSSWSQQSLRHRCTKPSRAPGLAPAHELPPVVPGCQGQSWLVAGRFMQVR